MFYIICYDIADDRRRRKLEKLLKGYGYRVQESVFEAFLDEKKYITLRDKVRRRIDEALDNVRFYRLCVKCTSATLVLGIGRVPEDYKNVIVV